MKKTLLVFTLALGLAVASIPAFAAEDAAVQTESAGESTATEAAGESDS